MAYLLKRPARLVLPFGELRLDDNWYLRDRLVGCWPLTSKSLALDANLAGWEGGRVYGLDRSNLRHDTEIGNSKSFAGTGEYIQVPDSSAFNFVSRGEVFTLTTWALKSFTTGGSNQRIIYRTEGNGDNYWGLVYDTGSNLWLTVVNNENSSKRRNADSVNAGQWYHLAMVVRSPTDVVFYENAVNQTGNHFNGLGDGDPNDFRFASRRASSDAPFYGSLAHVQLYKGELTPEEIGRLYARSTRFEMYGRAPIWVPTNPVSGPPLITGTGDLLSDDGAVVGIGVAFSTLTGTGALQSDDGAVGGIGEAKLEAEGTGALISGDGAVGGSGTIPAKVREGTGALVSQDGSVVGTGGGVVDATGALVAEDAVIQGVGSAFLLVTGTGDLQAEGGGVNGVGVTGEDHIGAGALVSDDAAVNGDGIVARVGSGSLVSGDASVVGDGTVAGTASGVGDLQSGHAFVTGFGHILREGAGALQADGGAVSGVGFNIKPSDTTLTTQDLANIQEAVWAKLVNEGLVAKVEELWQRRGLDPANPHRQSKSEGIIEVGGITIDVVGDANEVTQTRRP